MEQWASWQGQMLETLWRGNPWYRYLFSRHWLPDDTERISQEDAAASSTTQKLAA